MTKVEAAPSDKQIKHVLCMRHMQLQSWPNIDPNHAALSTFGLFCSFHPCQLIHGTSPSLGSLLAKVNQERPGKEISSQQ